MKPEMDTLSRIFLSTIVKDHNDAPSQHKMKVAMIGCGAVVTSYYTPALKELEQHKKVEVVALFDPNAQNLAGVRRFFPAAQAVANLNALANQGIELAIVASPPAFHAEQTICLLEQGSAVLCEKPLATSPADGQAMVDAAERVQQLLAVGLVRRFFPAARMIHEVLTQKLFGEVISFTYAEGEPFSWPARSASFFRKPMATGGVLLDTGVHVLDLLTWWWGEPVAIRYADDAMGGVEANCRLSLTFAGGHSGEVYLSRDCQLSNEVVIRCERGVLRWHVGSVHRLQLLPDESAYHLDGVAHQSQYGPASPTQIQPVVTFPQSFMAQLLNVIDAVQEKSRLLVPGVEGLMSLKLIDMCYRERQIIEMPWLSALEQTHARHWNEQCTRC